MPHHITHGDAVEVTFEQAHERLLRRDRWVRSFTAVAQQQPKVTAGQRRHHQEMIGADTVVKVVCPIARHHGGSASRILCTKDPVRGSACSAPCPRDRTARSCVHASRSPATHGPGPACVRYIDTRRRGAPTPIDNTHPAAPPPTINTGTSVMLGIDVWKFPSSQRGGA